jgi:hypothetical protein
LIFQKLSENFQNAFGSEKQEMERGLVRIRRIDADFLKSLYKIGVRASLPARFFRVERHAGKDARTPISFDLFYPTADPHQSAFHFFGFQSSNSF